MRMNLYAVGVLALTVAVAGLRDAAE